MFAKTLAEAEQVDAVVRGFDAEDPFSRREGSGFRARTNRVAVLPESQREFFGDADAAQIYADAIERVRAGGCEIVEFDYAPFLDAAALLYNGPWVAERLSALRKFLEKNADDVNPVVRGIVEGGARFSAVDAFEAQYRLAELTRVTERVWDDCDAILLPTAGTIYRVEEMLADPVTLNSNLGRYTNFVNLLDLAAIAVPAGFRSDGLPLGVTFVGPAWCEARLVELAGGFLSESVAPRSEGIRLAVVGAHLRGEPLNGQLLALGARFVEATRTAACYRLYALADTTPAKPGLVKADTGAAIEVEVWELSAAAFGTFVAGIPCPLGVGTLQLADGASVIGFLCEEIATRGARDITGFGGWRAFRNAAMAG